MFKIKNILFTFFIAVIFLFFFLKYANSLFIEFNEGYQVQLALSLKENFIYQSKYEPRKIADPEITVGFPQHYLQSIFFLIFGKRLESVRYFSSTIFILLLFLLYFYTKNILAPIYVFSFYLIASWFRNEISRYNGEILSTIFIILAIYFLDKFEKIKKNKDLLISGFFLSLAVTNKFISLITFFILFSIYDLRLKDKIIFTLTVFTSYLLTNFLIIINSYLIKFRTLDGLFGFFAMYKMQFKHIILGNFNKINLFEQNFIEFIFMKIRHFEGGMINFIFFYILPQIFLLTQGFFPYSIFSLLALLKIFFTMFWRHYIIFLLVLFSLIVKKMYKKWFNILVFIIIFFNIFQFLINKKNIFFQEIYSNNRSKNKQKEIAKRIDKVQGNIYTNGYWQGPEISFYTKKNFRDRMAYNQINNKNNNYLLTFSYQDGAWPFTDLNKLCDDIIFCEKTYILCRLKKGVYFNDLSDKNKGTKKCSKFKFD